MPLGCVNGWGELVIEESFLPGTIRVGSVINKSVVSAAVPISLCPRPTPPEGGATKPPIPMPETLLALLRRRVTDRHHVPMGGVAPGADPRRYQGSREYDGNLDAAPRR